MEQVSAAFPYEPQFSNVLGSKMHFIEIGKGEPIVFLHGMPTSCYLWRNILPYVSQHAHCIAPDLIGMGKSDKPDIDYMVFDHINYIENFIDNLGLDNITLMMHGWGSVIGFDYAMRNPGRIKGLAFYEAHLRPPNSREMVALPVQELATILDLPDKGYDVIMNSNYYVNKVMPRGSLRQLTCEEIKMYQEPFSQPGSSRPIWQYLQELPLGNGPDDVVDLIANYSEKLQKTEIPKLMFYAVPGFITTMDTVKWARDHFKHLRLVDIGDALHYAQESNPKFIGNELSAWYQSL